MSTSAILALLVPRKNFGARIKRLQSLQLDKESFPDEYIYGWDCQWILGDDNVAKEAFDIIENTNHSTFPSLYMQINKPTERTLANRGYQFATIGIFQECQGVFGNPEETIYIQVGVPLEDVGIPNNVALRLFLMKIAQVLDPLYGWNSTHESLAYHKDENETIPEPWLQTADTQIFGTEFYKKFNLRAKLDKFRTQYRDLYHARKLSDSLLWINSPRGLGLEWPAFFCVDVYDGESYNTWLHYVDTALDEIVEDATIKHDKALVALRDLIMAD